MQVKSSELVPDIVKTQEWWPYSSIITIFLTHKRKPTEITLNFTHGDQALSINGNSQKKFQFSDFPF